MQGKLYLIPTTIGTDAWESVIPLSVVEIARDLKYFIVENTRTARRYLSRIKINTPISELHFFELNEHTKITEIEQYLKPIREGLDMGILSEAGVPAVADPGSVIVALAHKMGVRVVPLTGPNSIILTLMASGLNGQNFAFVGYLPVKPAERQKRIRQLEQRSKLEHQTQIFIETPYRNIQVIQDLIRTCQSETNLTIGIDITTDNEVVITRKIKEWETGPIPDFNKRNAVFCILA